MAKGNQFKDWNEYRAFAATLPRGRRLVGYAGLPAFFVFSGLFWLAYHYDWGYTAGLIFAFLWFLFMSHSNYAIMKNLTQRKVRRIDYWYLGAASIGLFMFAVGYADQREMYFGKVMTTAFRVGEEKYREEVLSRLKQFQKLTCTPSLVRISNTACDASTQFVKEVEPGLSFVQVKAIEDKFRQVSEQYTRMFTRDQIQKIPQFFMPHIRVEMALEDWRKYMETLPSTAERKRDEEMEMLFGVGQMIIWPFILAYALALRITKVTIDVFEWAK